MPSTSGKQHRFMAAVASNPAFAKKAGVPQSVGEEFIKADKGRKFAGGGDMKESKKMVGKELAFMKKKGAPKSMIKHEMAEAGMKKMAMGGATAARAGNISQRDARGLPMRRPENASIEFANKQGQDVGGFGKGGKAKAYASGGLAAGHKAADGIAKKGKTKGTMVKMAMGGKAC